MQHKHLRLRSLLFLVLQQQQQLRIYDFFIFKILNSFTSGSSLLLEKIIYLASCITFYFIQCMKYENAIYRQIESLYIYVVLKRINSQNGTSCLKISQLSNQLQQQQPSLINMMKGCFDGKMM